MGANEQPLLLQRHRLTVDEYYRMAEVGLLAPDARTELIDGEIFDVATINSRHAGTVTRLNRKLIATVGEHAVVSCQNPLRLSDRSEPQPDLMLLRPRGDDYVESHPTPADVLLVIEVADSSARYEREIKVPLYARHAIAHLWVIDLDAGLVRLHHNPASGQEQYLDVSATPTPGVTPLPGLPGLSIDLTGILG